MKTIKNGYVSPETKTVVLRIPRVLCQSGGTQDYNTNTWDGSFDDAD